MPLNQTEAEEEKAHFSNVIATFQQYAAYALSANNRRRKDYHTIPLADRQLLDQLGYKEKLSRADRAIQANAKFLDQIIEDPSIFGDDLDADEENPRSHSHEHQTIEPSSSNGKSRESHGHPHSHSHDRSQGGHSHSHSHDAGIKSQPGRKRHRATNFDVDKLLSTLKQFVRDWSEEGHAERELSYGPMKEALLSHFSDIPPEERGNFRVLVPGAGLGRLAWDVANIGFACQGNEFSHYMLLASFFILNRTDAAEKHTIYPYVHSFSNLPSNEALLRPVKIPDVLPSTLREGSNFSLVAGDFEEIYGANAEDKEGEPQAGEWDAVMTCFFIDTAKNIVNYLRIIHRILAPGGVWINVGPLLWHWENNSTNDPSIELTLDEVKALARSIGFEISNERTIDTTYTNNAQSMLGYVYHAAFWTATKII